VRRLFVRVLACPPPPYRLFDGDGLALLVSTSGTKSWQLRYKLDDKDQTATLGKYPRVTLVEARDDADAKRKLVARGEHLTTVKRVRKVEKKAERANTFDTIATNWAKREARRQKWTPAYVIEVERSMRNHLSDLDGVPVNAIKAPTLATILTKVEDRAPWMLEKVRPRLDAILDYAVEMGFITGNPLPRLRRGRKKERNHYPAVTDLPGIGEILRAARAPDAIVCKAVQRGHHLLAHEAVRVSEAVGAKWSEFELDGVDVAIGGGRYRFDRNAGNWNIPRERMKRKDKKRGPHVVPLPPKLLAMLRQWRDEDGKDAVYAMPTPRDAKKHITPEAMEKHYRNVLGLAGKHSPHSWRAAFRSICGDAGKPGDVAEAQLDHATGNKTIAAYDRATRLELRRELLAWYEATLIAARDGVEATSIKARR
jgi:integrase